MITIQKRWFHGTTKENWKKIRESGILWSDPTFLARNLDQLMSFYSHDFPGNGDMFHRYELILSVKYIPNGIDDDYYKEGASRYKWELQVKKPISIENVKVLKYI